MSRLPAVSGKDVFRALNRNDYDEVRTAAGSHRFLKHATRGGLVTVPHTTKDLPKKTLGSILKQADLSADELAEML